MTIELYITKQCNFRCPHCIEMCNYIQDPAEDMSIEDVNNIINQINSLAVASKRVRLIGGEPTLHPKFLEICKLLKDGINNCYRFDITSNFTNNELLDTARKLYGFETINIYGSRDPNANAKAKLSGHYSILISPKDAGRYRRDPYGCQGLTDVCGMCVKKHNGQLAWAWCTWGFTVCRLLGNERYLYASLKELVRSRFNDFAIDICSHCSRLGYGRNNDGVVSGCFVEGLNRIKDRARGMPMHQLHPAFQEAAKCRT